MRRSREAEDPDRSFKLHMTDGGPRFILSAQPPSTETTAPTGAVLPGESRPLAVKDDATSRARSSHSRASATSHMRPSARRASRPARAEAATRQAAAEEPEAPRVLPQLVRPIDAPTQTHTVLDAHDNERLPTAFWKAALPPTTSQAPALTTVATSVAADYTVEAGVERIHAPVAFPEEAPQLLEQADSEAAARARRSGPSIFVRAWRLLRETRVPRALPLALVALSLAALAALRWWPDGTSTQDVAIAPAAPQEAKQGAPTAPPAVPQGSSVAKALGQGQYAVVARADDGSLTDRRNTDDLVGNDLETVQKLARIKSETMAQPLFIVAMRGGELKVVDRVNPEDRQAWREYTLAVWNLKQQSLSWPRENYLSRAALDPRRTLTIMSDFVRSHPDSRLVAAAFEDMRYVCYYTLQDPVKFRTITMQLLDEALRRRDSLRIPEIVYVVKPYLKETVNEMLYQRVHRFLGPQQAAAY